MKNVSRFVALPVFSILIFASPADARVTDLGVIDGKKHVFIEGKGNACRQIGRQGIFDVGANQHGSVNIFKNNRITGIKNCTASDQLIKKYSNQAETLKTLQETIGKLFSGRRLDHIISGDCICEWGSVENTK